MTTVTAIVMNPWGFVNSRDEVFLTILGGSSIFNPEWFEDLRGNPATPFFVKRAGLIRMCDKAGCSLRVNPEGVSVIQVGTSGFSFPDWQGTVYPEHLRERERLSYYEKSLGFQTVEINFTYYSLPSPKSFEAMVQKTSDRFEFVVKAFQGMTHDVRNKETGDWVDNEAVFTRFKQSLSPLVERGRLSCVLGQFPYGFFPDPNHFGYLQKFIERMEGIPVVFEFRNRDWLREGTFQFLDQNGIGYCIVDEPKLPKLMPYLPRVTSPIGYFRFHGRNPNWFNVPASVRYDYLYSEEELKAFVPDILEVSKKATKTFVFFNNCHAGSAAKNAARMAWLLTKTQEDEA